MKRVWICIITIILLVVIDQGAKLIIDVFYEYDSDALKQEMDTFHIHPLVNYEIPDKLSAYAEKSGINLILLSVLDLFGVLIRAAFAGWAIYSMYKVSLFSGTKKNSNFVYVLLVLVSAVSICVVFDRLFWGGTHDFLCVSKSFYTEDGRLMVGHLSSDIKDVYLNILVFLMSIYSCLFAGDLSRLFKDEQARATLKKLTKDRFMSFSHLIRKGTRNE